MIEDQRYQRFFGRYTQEKIDKFRNFHNQNPHIYSKFVELAHQIRNTGRKKYSAESIISVLRWDYDIQTTGSRYKISNDWRSMYPRLLAFEQPVFETFFSFKGDDK